MQPEPPTREPTKKQFIDNRWHTNKMNELLGFAMRHAWNPMCYVCLVVLSQPSKSY